MADAPSASARRRANIRQAVDFGALVAFMVAYAVNRFVRDLDGDDALVQATWVLVGASLIALIVGWVAEKRLAPLPLLTGGFALLFGTLTLLFNDPVLLKLKLTIQNGLLAVVLLGSLPLRRYPFKYLLGEAIRITDEGWRGLTLRYGLYFAVVAIVNEIVWRTQSDDTWVAFRGGLWVASAAFGVWQVFFIMKHLIKDEELAEPVSPDTGL
ncbi:inner membrane-spanning protein YciB [Brevundimonas viscosa]|uniref:Inner membrane-spanning protein YciB n=1 Tax=Brevundimonas viscosa TaxID=871741 RepID=A0A1I6NZ28_9CAUL|nr:septation protein IspZ [Brevundimonas viscosa]SFS33078.1 intracellular septation protein [Brevundimonas viscosa]